MRKPKQLPTIIRTTAGLRDILFEELDKLRNGKCSPGHANAFAKVCATIIETSRLEIDVAKVLVRSGEAKEVRPLVLGGPPNAV